MQKTVQTWIAGGAAESAREITSAFSWSAAIAINKSPMDALGSRRTAAASAVAVGGSGFRRRRRSLGRSRFHVDVSYVVVLLISEEPQIDRAEFAVVALLGRVLNRGAFFERRNSGAHQRGPMDINVLLPG
jgi:hypothetical protein